MARPRILLTGFGPFPGVTENPSAWLAETLAERPPTPEFDGELHAHVLPTEWQAAALTPRLYETLQPHVVLHFGVCEHAKAIRVERSAHNRVALRADAKGALPATPVVLPERPDRLDTAIPAAALARHLQANGVPAVTSHSAGQYLCNFLYYHSLDWARLQAASRHVLFVHVPPLSGKEGPFSEQTLLRGAHETLRFLLNFAATREPAQASGPASLRESVLRAKDA